jgi:FAD/FMN-containing dehydrogenase
MLVSALTLWLLQVFVKPILSAESDLEQAISALRPQLSPGATITFPSDPRWGELNSRASSPRLVPHFSVVVEVAAESDVQATVTVASQYDIPFLAITGRHGWTSSLNKLPYGFQINLRGLNSSALSSDGKTATIGGGIIQYELVRSLFEKGKYAGEINIWHP